MEYLVLGVVVILFLAGKGIYDKKKYKERVRRMLREGFGTVSDEEYSAEKMKSRKILPGNQYIKTILCQAAWSAVRVRNSSFANWFCIAFKYRPAFLFLCSTDCCDPKKV